MDISFIAAMAIVVVGLMVVMVELFHKRRTRGIVVVLAVTVFLAGCSIFYPIYNAEFAEDGYRGLLTVILSVHNTIRLFVVDGEFTIITDFARGNGGELAVPYTVLSAFLFVAAPLLTFSFVATFFHGFAASFGLFVCLDREWYVFSELNEKSYALAKSLREARSGKKHQKNKRCIIFTGVAKEDLSNHEGIVEDAKQKLGAILISGDITNIYLRAHSISYMILKIIFPVRKKRCCIFMIGENEDENLVKSMDLVSRYKNEENMELYLFSGRAESEAVTSAAVPGPENKEKIGKRLFKKSDADSEIRDTFKVRRIDPTRTLVENLLYDRGKELFENASEKADHKKIGVVILGLGGCGMQMLKTLSWYLQMDGYLSEINAFDREEGILDKLKADCPELLDEKHNGKRIEGDAQYDIKIHEGIDVEGSRFMEELEKIEDITYIFVSVGSDELNIRTVMMLQMLCARAGKNPIIHAISYNKALNDELNHIIKGNKINFIGAVEWLYSEKVIMNSELEANALRIHACYDIKEDIQGGDAELEEAIGEAVKEAKKTGAFWRSEYGYHSSMATALHNKTEIELGILDDAALEDKNKLLKLQELEHKRWNAYMRSEGYVYPGESKSQPGSKRDSIAKTHEDIIPWSSELENEDKKKDFQVLLVGYKEMTDHV